MDLWKKFIELGPSVDFLNTRLSVFMTEHERMPLLEGFLANEVRRPTDFWEVALFLHPQSSPWLSFALYLSVQQK